MQQRRVARTLILPWLLLTFLTICLLVLVCLYVKNVEYIDERDFGSVWVRDPKFVDFTRDGKVEKVRYNRSIPLVFVGGVPRSGTTLLRVILDTHPDIRCGEETRLLPRILMLRHGWTRSKIEARRLKEAGITPRVMDKAIAELMLEIIVHHGPYAKLLCNKDPLLFKSIGYIKELFPNAKFLHIVRDGRAVAHSIVSRKVTIGNVNNSDYSNVLGRWNELVSLMHTQCVYLGPKVCMLVRYENLVLHPEATTKQIANFLNVPWTEKMLQHDKLIDNKLDDDDDDDADDDAGEEAKISLSSLERSTDQVVKPVNTNALLAWVGHIPPSVVDKMSNIAPMLAVLGYDPKANPPNYGAPDKFVVVNTKKIQE